MLSERQLANLLKVFDARMQAVSDDYLKRMGEHLKEIGRLTASDVHRLKELKRVGMNVRQVKKRIASAADASMADVERVLRAAAESDEAFARQWFAQSYAPAVKGLPKLSTPVERILKAQLRVTAQRMKNLSNTTILSEGYRDAVDVAIQAVQSGVVDYNTAIRSAMKKAAQENLRVVYSQKDMEKKPNRQSKRVEYPRSGMTRRLDSAVQQNVLDGVRALNNDILRQLGNEYGADGVETSVHALCAADHLPYQGLQFSRREFEELQNRLDRPFGVWNCKHTIFPIILGVSEPAHTPEELEAYRRFSSEAVEIDGVTRTRYEWSQEQRRIETAVRYQKDIAITAKASGDDVARREAQRKINVLKERYGKVSNAAGLEAEPERMRVSEFRAVKTVDQLKKRPNAPKPEVKQPVKRSAPQREKPFTVATNESIMQGVNTNSAAIQNTAVPIVSTKESNNGVNSICKIDRNIYSCVSKDIATDEVIITDERIQHIKDRHPNDFERYFQYMTDMIVKPQYIIEDADVDTAFIVKQYANDDTQFRLILRLHTTSGEKGRKNSVITFQYIKAKEFSRLVRNKKILYKDPEL